MSYHFAINGEGGEDNATKAHKNSVVSTLAPLKTEIQAQGSAEPANNPRDKPETWWFRFWCDVNASDYFIALFTLVLALATYFLWRETERLAKGADDQSEKMAASITAAGRSAKAMEDVATSMATNAQTAVGIANMQREYWPKQMRAYISVEYVETVHQDETTGYNFEIRLGAVNNGLTPAYDVSYWASADILPFPLPDHYPLPNGDGEIMSAGVLGPRSTFLLNAFAPHMYAANEVTAVKQASGKRLYIWGTLKYKDVENVERYVNFCRSVAWYATGRTLGTNSKYHNDSN